MSLSSKLENSRGRERLEIHGLKEQFRVLRSTRLNLTKFLDTSSQERRKEQRLRLVGNDMVTLVSLLNQLCSLVLKTG